MFRRKPSYNSGEGRNKQLFILVLSTFYFQGNIVEIGLVLLGGGDFGFCWFVFVFFFFLLGGVLGCFLVVHFFSVYFLHMPSTYDGLYFRISGFGIQSYCEHKCQLPQTVNTVNQHINYGTYIFTSQKRALMGALFMHNVLLLLQYGILLA